MKTHLPGILTVLFIISGASAAHLALAQATDSSDNQSGGDNQSRDDQDDQGVARVARLSYIDGEVSFMRADDKEWIPAAQNLPLLPGDQVYTGAAARAELQLARGTFVRLAEKTAVTISELSDTAVQLQVTNGIAIIETSRSSGAFDRFEIDTPVAAMLLQDDGLYRVDVRSNGESEIMVRRGYAEVTTDDGNLKLREGHRLVAGNGQFEVVAVNSYDNWDLWNTDRDTVAQGSYSASPDYVGDYETTYSTFYGADELAGCGTWTTVSSYGNCWVPRVAYGWAPYRYGQWVWIPRIGWSWQPSEPWGWAPYHYGRWSLIPGLGWAWVPGFHLQPSYSPGGYGYYRWRPALVYFFNYTGPRGQYVGWVPLGPRDAWHGPAWYANHPDPWRARYGSIAGGWSGPGTTPPRGFPARPNGISVLPLEAFNGSRPGRPESADLQGGSLLGVRRLPGNQQLGPEVFRPGLAGVTPAQFAKVPASTRGTGQVAVKPSAEVMTRTVVTRHDPAMTPRMTDQGPGWRNASDRRNRSESSENQSGSGLSGHATAGGGASTQQGNGSGASNRKANGDGQSGSVREQRHADRPSGNSGGATSAPARTHEPRAERYSPPPRPRSEQHQSPSPSPSHGDSGSHSNNSGSHTDGGSHSSSGSHTGGGSQSNGGVSPKKPG